MYRWIGFTFLRGTAGWGVFAHRSDNSETSLWGPVITDPSEFNWIGASCPNNNTGIISAIYHALRWLSGDSKKHAPGPPPRVNLLTDSVYCVRLFGTTNRTFNAFAIFSTTYASFVPCPSPGLKHILAPPPRTPLEMPQRIDLRPEDVRAPPACSCARPSPSAVPDARVPSPPP